MQIMANKHGFTIIEFFLSVVALFLLLIITYPILQESSERSERSKIKENLNQIRDCSEQYFEEHTVNSVSLFNFVGPRKEISELKIIADEEYSETIYRGKEISAFSKKYGSISVE
jgi:Tfp pilus assembly protein PilE